MERRLAHTEGCTRPHTHTSQTDRRKSHGIARAARVALRSADRKRRHIDHIVSADVVPSTLTCDSTMAHRPSFVRPVFVREKRRGEVVGDRSLRGRSNREFIYRTLARQQLQTTQNDSDIVRCSKGGCSYQTRTDKQTGSSNSKTQHATYMLRVTKCKGGVRVIGSHKLNHGASSSSWGSVMGALGAGLPRAFGTLWGFEYGSSTVWASSQQCSSTLGIEL